MSSSGKPITSLPSEVLYNVFSFLVYRDKLYFSFASTTSRVVTTNMRYYIRIIDGLRNTLQHLIGQYRSSKGVLLPPPTILDSGLENFKSLSDLVPSSDPSGLSSVLVTLMIRIGNLDPFRKSRYQKEDLEALLSLLDYILNLVKQNAKSLDGTSIHFCSW